MAAFHEVLFPTAISRGSQGGPERRTDIVVLGSGAEERNARWAHSRRRYNAGWGIKTLDELHAVVAFFEERRGRLHGFRWRDHMDFRSCPPERTPTVLDQQLGVGDGVRAAFQLVKTYGGAHLPWQREIAKPVGGSIVVAVDGVAMAAGSEFVVDPSTGVVTFLAGHVPGAGTVVTAGFEFDVPVRFDTDMLDVSVQGVRHGSIPSIPIVEIRP